MALNSKHPQYSSTVVDQQLMRDAYAGERLIKEKGTEYLPPMPSMVLDGMGGTKRGQVAYDAYKMRAVFPDFVSDAVERLMGLMHQKPATIEVPAQMNPLIEKMTVDGESAQDLLRRINEQQLVTGRTGLLLDLPMNPDPSNPLPYVALYCGEALLNWDDGSTVPGENKLELVVMNESGFVRDNNFEWREVERYRVLELKAPEENSKPVFRSGLFEGSNTNYSEAQMKMPMLRGKTLEQIPFVFINSKDNLPTPDNPPLLGLGRLSLTIYRGEADYRQCLFMQGQDTLVIEGGMKQAEPGGDDETRVGAGAVIEVDMGGSAQYIGVSSLGLSELRTSLENDRKQASMKSGQLIDQMGAKAESGDALDTRLAAQTATLNQLALAGARGLEKILKICAEWMGLNPNDVKVSANLEFADMTLDAAGLSQIMGAKLLGAPISLESIHRLMQNKDMTNLSFEDEIAKIMEEKPLLPQPADDKGNNE